MSLGEVPKEVDTYGRLSGPGTEPRVTHPQRAGT